MRVLCIATSALLPQTRVLARSLARHEPSWPLEVVLLGVKDPSDDELTLTSVGEELDSDVEVLLARNDLAAVTEALVPRLLLARCRDGEGDGPWLHLPPSVWVCGSLGPLLDAVRKHGVLLVPRATEDPPLDGLEPSRSQLDSDGRIAPDILAVDGSPKSHQFLEWWNGRLEGHDSEPGAEAWAPEYRRWARRLLELAPARFDTALLGDPGCNLSAWNLHRHSLDETTDGVRVDERWPLLFMNLEGYDPDRPFRLSVSSSRVRLSRDPLLKRLSLLYAHELMVAGWRDMSGRQSVGERLADGVVFDETMASLLSEARVVGRDFGDLSSADGKAAFLAWLREPAWPGAPAAIGRYIFRRVLRDRPDVRAAYPDLYTRDSDEFAEWCQSFGVRELDIPQAVVPTPAVIPVAPDPQPEPEGHSQRRRALRRSRRAARGREKAPEGPSGGRPLSVRVTGYMGHVLGLGSAARGYVQGLQAAGVPVSTVSVPLHHQPVTAQVPSAYGREQFDDVIDRDTHAFEIVCVNPDELPSFVERTGESFFRGTRIGVWAWETDAIPSRWSSAFELVDEVWVNSQFMAQNIGAVSPVPVVALPPAIGAPETGGAPLRLGVPEGYLFLFVFDYLSTIRRKNPVGLINAFKHAFAPGEGPRLLIKTFNAPLRPLAEEEVLWAAGDRPDIHVIDRSLSSQERDRLMATCDCYVSLHRSEGFGLTLCEAMALGKPVIATGYSGNLDFMNEQNSFLVDYELTRVGADCEIYPPDGRWADPDIEHAAELMRSVYESPELTAAAAARGRQDIARLLAPETTGKAMRRRLEERLGGTSARSNAKPESGTPPRGAASASAGSKRPRRPAPAAGASRPRKALVTAGIGQLAHCLDISRPTFEEFARRHSYAVVLGDESEAEGRPASWGKIRLLQRALADYEAVLWVDADALIVDPDLEPEVPAEHFQGLVRHHTGEGEVPNAGVWLLRAGTAAQAFLQEVWDRTDLIEHPWWESAAVMTLLGYDLGEVKEDGYARGPCRLSHETPWLAQTTWLDGAWNSIGEDPASAPRIRHWPGLPVQQRLAEMSAVAAAVRVRELIPEPA